MFKVNRDLVGTPGLEISFPKKGTGISASWTVAPGGTVAASTMTYDATTIKVLKGGIQLRFTNEALESALRAVIKDHIYDAGIVWAETIDQVALESHIVNATATTTTITTGSSYAATTFVPIWSYTSHTSNGTAGTLNGIDYYGGTFYFTGSVAAANQTTVSFKYAAVQKTSGNYVEALTPKTLSTWDMLKARAMMVADHYRPNVCVIHDDDIPSLLYDEKLKFLDVSAYGRREAILNAEIGKIFGMKVLTTAISHMETGHVLYIDTENMGYNVFKRDLKATREEKPEVDSVYYHMWGEQNFGVVNANAIVMSVNHGPDSGSLQAVTANPA